MDAVFIPNEQDFKKWRNEAIAEYFNATALGIVTDGKEEPLLSRKEADALLRISLVTLTNWVKHGLPAHKQRGRVYFTRSGIMTYLKAHQLAELKFGRRFERLG